MLQPMSSNRRRPRRLARKSVCVFGVVFLSIEFVMIWWAYQVIQKQFTSPLSDIEDITHSTSSSAAFSPQSNSFTNEEGRPKRRRRPEGDRNPDGHFNGYPVYYHDLTQNTSYHSRPYSAIRCVGENYQGIERAWMYRSCHFRFMCFNLSSKEFEIYQRPEDRELQQQLLTEDSTMAQNPPKRPRNAAFWDLTSSVLLDANVSTLSIGGLDDQINMLDGTGGQQQKLRWFPKIVSSNPPERYFALEEDLVFAPFHSSSDHGGKRHHHMALWEDLLPIYTLLNIFQLVEPNLGADDASSAIMNGVINSTKESSYNFYDENHREALLIRYVLSEESPTSYTGPIKSNDDDYLGTLNKLMPLMIYDHQRHHHNHSTTLNREVERQQQRDLKSMVLTTQNAAVLRLNANVGKHLESNLVCAKDGIAGLGPLTGHGFKKKLPVPGRRRRGHKVDGTTHNHGRGGLLWRFRCYCLFNLGLIDHACINKNSQPASPRRPASSIRIVFSTSSTAGSDNNLGVKPDSCRHEQVLLDEFQDDDTVSIESSNFHAMSLLDQVQLALQSTIFVMGCGVDDGSAIWTATFLPRGATLIVLYKEQVGGEEATGNDGAVTTPIRLEWDLLNNLSYLRVHWLPLTTITTTNEDLTIFSNLIRREIYFHRRKVE